MKKRILSMLLVLALMLGLTVSFATVASADAPTLTLFVDESWWPYDTWKGAVCETFNENAGVNIEVTIAADDKQLPLMVASGDMTDLVCSYRLEHMANENVSYALDELKVQYPDIDFPVHSVLQFVNTMSDGHFYTIGCGYSPDSVYEEYPGILAEGTGLVIRQDILDEMGNPEINTFEDLEAVFARVKAGYPDMMPAIFNCIHQFGWVRQMMGVSSSGYYDAGGELVWYIRQPEQLDYYKKVNQWYRDGYLMSENFAFKTEAEEQELMAAGKAFADFCYGNHADMFNAKVTANGDSYEMTQFLGVLTENAAKYDNYAGGRGLYVTKSAQDVEAAFRALAYAYSDEGMKLLMWGIEGEDYTLDDRDYPLFNYDTQDNDAMSVRGLKFWGWLVHDAFVTGVSEYGSKGQTLAAREVMSSYTVRNPVIGMIRFETDSDEAIIKSKLDDMIKSEQIKIYMAESEEECEAAYYSMIEKADQLGMKDLEVYGNETYARLKPEYDQIKDNKE